jgi:signal peptidase I
MFHIRRVKNRSMEPTLKDNFLILTKTFKLATRGKIVTFQNPKSGSETLIKRIVAVKGDHLEIKDGSILLNGAILKETYISDLPKTMTLEENFNWDLKDDSVVVLSDNRLVGNFDSRMFGSIKTEHLLEEFITILWPIKLPKT